LNAEQASAREGATMRIAISGGDGANHGIEYLVAQARQLADDGFPSYYLNTVFAVDATVLMSVLGREVPDLELVSAVVPVHGRHPIHVAQLALTAQMAATGRFVLGLGLSHRPVVEDMWGLSFADPVSYMREFVEVLVPLMRRRWCVYEGRHFDITSRLFLDERTPPPVLLGALGPRMLDLAGEMTDGTITFLTGPKTLREFTVPTITRAAERAGKPSPRVIAILPICVTDDARAARRRATVEFRRYEQLPSYRAMFDREGVRGPADVALIGDEETVARAVAELSETGITDLVAERFGSKAEQDRTRLLLRSLLPDVERACVSA
jgi:F420-dependent oxidoreductase-like protein